MNDTTAIYRAFLAAQSTLTDVTGARIYADALPVGWLPTDGPSVVFRVAAGDSNEIAPAQRIFFEGRCYAATRLAAWALYQALWDSTHGKQMQTQNNVRIWWILERFTGRLEVDPDTGWFYVLNETEAMIEV